MSDPSTPGESSTPSDPTPAPAPASDAPATPPASDGPAPTSAPAPDAVEPAPAPDRPVLAAADAAAAVPAAEQPRKRRRRRRKKKSGAAVAGGQRPAPGGNRPRRGDAHHAMTAIRALAQMADELLDIEGVDLLGRPRFMDVSIRVPLDPKRDGSRSASSLVEQILARVREVREHEGALVPGSVYCYFSGSAEGETSRPTEPRQVFDGYTSTGRPQFTDFVTLAIERKDEGIDALVDGQDVIVTHVSAGRVLRTQQLAEFGKSSPVYRILGQVDAGLYPVLNAPHKAAFSFQVLRGATLEGKPRLRIHAVGAADVRDIADPSVPEILRRFQQRLDQEALRLAGREANGETAEDADEEFVLPLLQDLARSLSGRAKRKSRRTEHAVQRADEGQRPTAKASEDAKAADDAHILEDDTEGTIVILGARGRVHVYTRDAKHVTSFMMQTPHVNKRKQSGRWRPADPAARGEFRLQFKKRLGTGEAEAPPTPEPALRSEPASPPESGPIAPAAPTAPPATPSGPPQTGPADAAPPTDLEPE